MDLFAHFDALHVIAGLIVGLLVGLTGVGGGSLMTPLLVLLFGVQPQTAVGTDLLYAAVTKVAGSGIHGWRETVDWRIVRRLASGSLPAAVLTLVVLAHVGKVGAHTQNLILLAVGVMLTLTAVAVLLQKRLIAYAAAHAAVPPRSTLLPTVALGVVLGVAVSVSSVGAGAIGVSVLLLLYPQLPVAKIVGTDIAHAMPLALVAGFGHWIIGDVDVGLLVNLLVGSIPGVILGSLVASRAPDRWLRPALAVVLLLSSWQLVVKGLTPAKHASGETKPKA